ncbi:unnamed protein product [Pylaiella littoralis]
MRHIFEQDAPSFFFSLRKQGLYASATTPAPRYESVGVRLPTTGGGCGDSRDGRGVDFFFAVGGDEEPRQIVLRPGAHVLDAGKVRYRRILSDT